MKHFKYGGSTAGRTIQCPSWITLAETLPKNDASSSYAEEGTALHTCMEMLLEGEIDTPDDVLSKDIGGVVITDVHVARLWVALEAWDAFCKEHNILDFEVEQTFELNEDIGGTTDVMAWSSEKVHIVDWKFGQGVEVDAENSEQGMFYGLTASHSVPELFLDRDLSVAIIQPIDSRGEHETCKTWDVPPKTFAKFRTDLFAAIQYEGEPKYAMGKHCKFCPAATICPAKTGAANAALRIGDGIAKNVAESLELAYALDDWITDVKKYAHEQLELGVAIPGYKLVAKRADRKFSDIAAAEEKLRKMVKSSRGENNLKVTDVFAAPKLLSAPQIEKVFKAKKLDFSKIGDYIVKESSGNTLARDSDKRPAVLSVGALKQALDRTT